MRRPFVAGNWKMNLSLKGTVELARRLRDELAEVDGVELAVFPPFVFLPAVQEVLRSSNIGLGAQNLHWKDSGAFTGEVAGPMLNDVGCRYVIIGHSERRHIMRETDEDVNAKLLAALSFGLNPICCVGETLDERRSDRMSGVVRRQVGCALKDITAAQMKRVTIAYEPVWAIGTGVNATSEQAQEVHAIIRAMLAERFGSDVAEGVRIQYGGSVKPENAAELMAAQDIDGALVGGASLKADSFVPIVRAAIRSPR